MCPAFFCPSDVISCIRLYSVVGDGGNIILLLRAERSDKRPLSSFGAPKHYLISQDKIMQIVKMLEECRTTAQGMKQTYQKFKTVLID